LKATGSQRFNTWRYSSGDVIISDSEGNIVKRFYSNGHTTLYGPYENGCQGWFAITYDSQLGRYETHGDCPHEIESAVSLADRSEILALSFVEGNGYVDYSVVYKSVIY
jgi:antitoxin component YwqK of YwqJK toxin-antitoxin module